MKTLFLANIIICFMSSIGDSRPQILLPQELLVKGIMEKCPDQTFKGKDTIYNSQSIVWHSRELKRSEKESGVVLNYPNSFEPSFDVHFRLVKADSVTISYYNSKHTLVSISFRGFLTKGDYTYHVTENYLVNGDYYIKCTIGKRSWVQNASKWH